MPPRGGSDRAALRQAAAMVGVVLGVYLLAFLPRLAVVQGDPATFVRFGSRSATTDFSRAVLGAEVYAPTWRGHDGQTFWVLARDPLLLDPTHARNDIEAPGTRAGRILYPALAAPFRLGGETALLWGMLAVNVVALAGGTYVTSRFAQRLGGTARGGIAFAANPTVYFGMLLDLSDVLAVALSVGFVSLVDRRRFVPAVLLGVLATMAKESTLVVVLSVAVLAPGLPRRFRLAAPAAAGATYGLWMLYQRSRIGTDVATVRAFDVVPFRGLYTVVVGWWLPSMDYYFLMLVAELVFLTLAVYIVVRFVRRRNLLMAAALPAALVTPFYVGEVFKQPEDLGRSLGAALTFLALDMIAERATPRPRAAPVPIAADPSP